jgi:hypothetical protein
MTLQAQSNAAARGRAIGRDRGKLIPEVGADIMRRGAFGSLGDAELPPLASDAGG